MKKTKKAEQKSRKDRLKRQGDLRSVGLSPKQVDRALKHLLTSTLALYVLNNSQKPTSDVVNELMNLEVKAAHLVGLVMQLQSEKLSGPALDRTLAGAFSFIPIPRKGTAPPSAKGK